mmetsp:Transcript_8206/g.25616  ORF Transcript_8206/g.25616 Transcript_8206/m.25616 type:complete len:271 (-) Transcript_8206:368-1180(-)
MNGSSSAVPSCSTARFTAVTSRWKVFRVPPASLTAFSTSSILMFLASPSGFSSSSSTKASGLRLRAVSMRCCMRLVLPRLSLVASILPKVLMLMAGALPLVALPWFIMLPKASSRPMKYGSCFDSITATMAARRRSIGFLARSTLPSHSKVKSHAAQRCWNLGTEIAMATNCSGGSYSLTGLSFCFCVKLLMTSGVSSFGSVIARSIAGSSVPLSSVSSAFWIVGIVGSLCSMMLRFWCDLASSNSTASGFFFVSFFSTSFCENMASNSA